MPQNRPREKSTPHRPYRRFQQGQILVHAIWWALAAQRDEVRFGRSEIECIAIGTSRPGPVNFEADELHALDGAFLWRGPPARTSPAPLEGRDDGLVQVLGEVALDVAPGILGNEGHLDVDRRLRSVFRVAQRRVAKFELLELVLAATEVLLESARELELELRTLEDVVVRLEPLCHLRIGLEFLASRVADRRGGLLLDGVFPREIDNATYHSQTDEHTHEREQHHDQNHRGPRTLPALALFRHRVLQPITPVRFVSVSPARMRFVPSFAESPPYCSDRAGGPARRGWFAFWRPTPIW